MPVERHAQLVGLTDSGATLQLRAQCEGCTGCGGRCDLSAWLREDASGELQMPPGALPAGLRPGDWVRLQFDPVALRRAAWRAYAWPTLGLVAGAAMAAWLSTRFGGPRDPLTAIGAAIGTFFGSVRSKRTDRLPVGVRILR